MDRLKRRTDFRAAASGLKASGKAFMLQARRRADESSPRVGYTVSRQVGNAVERNRVRRRLREMVRLTPAAKLRLGHDYVVIGRRAALAMPFSDMTRELDTALRRIHTPGGAPAATGESGKRLLHEAGPQASPPASARDRSVPRNRPTHEQ